MNKKTKFLVTSLCSLTLAFSIPLASVSAATIPSRNMTNKAVIHKLSTDISGYATERIMVYANHSLYSSIAFTFRNNQIGC